MSDTIELKGVRDGLLASLPVNISWEETLALFRAHLDRQPEFFKGARLAVNVGAHTLKVNDLVTLRNELSERGITLWAVLSDSPTTVKNAQLLGLATRIARPRPSPAPNVPASAALWLERTLRSGIRIEHTGPVTIIGDVNPGAEILTSSSLIVWGRLRGRVLVGHPDNQQAFICALRFQTDQATLAGIALSAPSTDCPLKVSLQQGIPRWEQWEK
ncbi:MAG: septum site-determining protein MinC [Anaerolineales bacterium]